MTSKKNIFITGDSFAFHRTQVKDWPYEVAQALDLKLQGAGYPGYSWWPSLVSLQQYAKTKDFKNTDYFIFVHTQFSRPLGFSESFNPKCSANPDHEDYHVWEYYAKYFYNYQFNQWATEKYIDDINKLCEGKKVIHIRAFLSDEQLYKNAYGIIIDEAMITFTDLKNAQSFWNYGRNHMEPDLNSYWAQQLVRICRKYNIYGPKKSRNVWMSIHDAK